MIVKCRNKLSCKCECNDAALISRLFSFISKIKGQIQTGTSLREQSKQFTFVLFPNYIKDFSLNNLNYSLYYNVPFLILVEHFSALVYPLDAVISLFGIFFH